MIHRSGEGQLRACAICNAVYLARLDIQDECPKCVRAQKIYDRCQMGYRVRREAQYRARWDGKGDRVRVLHGLDGQGREAVFYEEEMIDLLKRGWLIPGAVIEWKKQLYMVAGEEFHPQWLERMGG